MKKLFFAIAVCLVAATAAFAQSPKNDSGDSIIGNYESVQGGEPFKVKFTKNSDGTYKGQIYWMAAPNYENGQPKLDDKNPDKSLRKVHSDKVVLVDGLKYDAAKKQWNGAKIYDPTRGIKAHVTICFNKDGKLMVKGTVLGIGETAYWNPCN